MQGSSHGFFVVFHERNFHCIDTLSKEAAKCTKLFVPSGADIDTQERKSPSHKEGITFCEVRIIGLLKLYNLEEGSELCKRSRMR